MGSLGDFAAGATIDFKFTTINASATPTTLAGSPVVSIYKDNSTTQSTAGVTLTVDFDGVTGLHHVRITTASDASFYAAGSSFCAVITTGTVGGSSVAGNVIEHFTLELVSTALTRAAGVETGYTLQQAMRIILAMAAGKLSGAATATNTFRDVNDSVNRIVATVDSDGNRTALTLTST